jgi:tRNA dimethylallyltransferase
MSGVRRERPIVVVAGPTGVGKTHAAIELCKRFGGEIVGADSVQIYREFDIGSNKPTPDELQGIAHHLIDVLAPTDAVDAARYAALADAAIDAVHDRGALPFVVGGTGLWLRALLRGLIDLPQVDPALRAGLEREWHNAPEALHARLSEVDPRTAARVHPSDMVRVVRALEVHAQTGQALGALHAAHALGAPRYRALTVVLDVPIEEFRTAVAARTRAMLARGWADEVAGLVERYGPEIRPLRSVGYRQLVQALQERWETPETERRITRATRLFAKRQRNWFRSEPSVDLRMQPHAVLEPAFAALLAQHLAAD